MKQQYKNWHDYFPSSGNGKEFPWLLRIIEHEEITSALDWGCGKGGTADYIELMCQHKIKIRRYDPGYEPYRELPTDSAGHQFEFVYSTDVFEHIEAEDIDGAIENIHSLTRGLHAHIIDLTPAKKKLPDGRNAHVTLWTTEQWQKKFAETNAILRADTFAYPDKRFGERHRLHIVCRKH